MAKAISVGILGASGYSGGELIRLLSGHPEFAIKYLAAGNLAGKRISDVHQNLLQFGDELFMESRSDLASECDLVFIALPHGESAAFANSITAETKIVDLGADFRLQNAKSWEKYYGGPHAGTWVYGLADLPGKSEEISTATRVANPGCYATAISLAIAPALDFIEVSDITVVAASGTTGGGRGAKVSLLGSEVMNSLSSYKFGGVHQHTPEIEEVLTKTCKREVKISFTPILAPMPRGILATITARLNKSIQLPDVRTKYENYFVESNFISLLADGLLPKTSSLIGSNSVHIQVAIDQHTDRLIVSAALDNLGKGAAGQAIQSANLMCGLGAEAGLQTVGVGI